MARIVSAVGVAIVVGTLVGCNQKPPPTPAPPPPQVKVQKPIRRQVQDSLEYSGRTDAVEMVEIRTRVRGFLQTVKFQEGVEVKKGDLLYEIDPRTFESDLASARAEVGRLEALVVETKRLAENAEQLYKTKAGSQEDLISRTASRDQALASLNKAKAAVVSSELELGFTKIYSPIDGRISRTLVTAGNLVGYNEPTLLTNIVRLDPIYVFFDGSENKTLEYDKLIRDEGATTAEAGTVPVEVGTVVDKGFPYKGFINFRENRIDPGTATIRIRGQLDNKQRLFQPGQFVRVKIPFGKPKQRVIVPETAVSADQRGRYLLTVSDKNIAEYRQVRVGSALGDGTVVIEEGIGPEDRVIVAGLQRARPGAPVTPDDVKPPEPPSSPAKGTSAGH